MRKARGAMLFKEYQAKMGRVQGGTTTPAAASTTPPERQKITE